MKISITYFAIFFAMVGSIHASNESAKHTNCNYIPAKMFVSAHIWSYNSYSQQKMGYPIKAGYPVIQSQGVAVNVGYSFLRGSKIHSFSVFTTAPTGLTSNNGTGQNYLLADNEISYHKSNIGYKLWMNLFDYNNISARHAFSSGLLYESRNLPFMSGTKEKTSDINLYLGPCLHVDYSLNHHWHLIGGFDAHFFLPYLNYGSLKTFSDIEEQTFSSPYRGFYYQTNFSLGLKYIINNQTGIKVAFSKDDLVGFANRKPSFRVNDIVHYKLDRVYSINVGVVF